MEEKNKRIGQILIESGFITQEQLSLLLEEQKTQPHLNLGEMVSKKFQVPTSTIETLFVEKIVLPSVRTILLQALTQELSPFIAQTEFKIDALHLNMDIETIEIARTVTSCFSAVNSKQRQMDPVGKRASTLIQGTISLSIEIANGVIIQPHDNQIQFTMDESTGAISLEQCKLDGLKYSFRRMIKSEIGIAEHLDLIQEKEIQELLARYSTT